MIFAVVQWLFLCVCAFFGPVLRRCGSLEMALPLASRRLWLAHVMALVVGAAVVLLSMAAVVPMQVASIYITAKSAVLGLMEVLRGELKKDGISTSAFCPGPVQTSISGSGELRPDKYRQDSGLLT